MKSAPTIAFDYAPSLLLLAALCVVGSAAAFAPWLSALPLPACMALSLLALAVAAFSARSLWHPPFVRVGYRGDGWVLLDAGGNEHAAVLHSYRHLGAFVALDWSHARRARFRIVLAPDNADADTRRRLVLLLRRVAHADAAADLP